MSEIPYVGFSTVTLNKLPTCKIGDEFLCPKCNKRHVLIPADDGSFLLGFYKCGEKTYLGSIFGKFVVPFNPDCSGKL